MSKRWISNYQHFFYQNENLPWVASIENILPCRCQIRIKQKPEKLTASRIWLVLFSSPSHCTKTGKGEHRGLSTSALIFDGCFVERTLIARNKNFRGYQAFTVGPLSDRFWALSDVSICWAIRISRLHHKTITPLDLHLGVKSLVNQINKVSSRDGRCAIGFFRSNQWLAIAIVVVSAKKLGKISQLEHRV